MRAEQTHGTLIAGSATGCWTEPLPGTLLEVLRRAGCHKPTRGIRLFRAAREVEYLSYARLYDEAGSIAAGLVDRQGQLRGERVALVLPTSGDWLRAFFGVLAAGAVPVPLPSPLRFSSPQRFGERIRNALLQSRIRLVVSNEKMTPILNATAASLGIAVRICSVAELWRDRAEWQELSPGDPALVQYTSGSTTSPKGVVLTHGQIVANLEAMRRGLDMREDDIGCSWLPLFHDMGLIGCFLGVMHGALDQLLMPAEDFIREPRAWLQVVSRYRATLATAPNWAYGQCVDRIGPDDAKALDLSHCRVALNGAEMVDAAITRGFARRFQSAGFRPEAMFPVYGLAEAGLAVTFPPLERGVKSVFVRRSALNAGVVQLSKPGEADTREVVSVGRPVFGVQLQLLNSEGHRIPEAMVGEIVIRGPSVMSGYERDAQATRGVFHQGWLRTGDLGFLLDGELFISGRAKDVFIVRGQNIYAQDVEALASRVEGVWSRNTMAISIPTSGTEGLVVLAETRIRNPDTRWAITSAIRETVSATLGVPLEDVALLRPGQLPRTSSGKLERYKGCRLYESCDAEVSNDLCVVGR